MDLTAIGMDPYLIPGTDVLQNKLGITDGEQLKEMDKKISLERLYELRTDALGCFQKEGLITDDSIQFGPEHLKRIHYYLFHDVYPFAGEYRTMDIVAKGRHPAPADYIIKFMTHYDIEMELSMTLSNMVRTLPYKQFSDKDAYADWLATYFERTIYIHPFREGNGRSIKEYFTEFVEYNNDKLQLPDVELRWDRMDADVLSNITYQMTVDEDCVKKQFRKGIVYQDQKESHSSNQM